MPMKIRLLYYYKNHAIIIDLKIIQNQTAARIIYMYYVI